jgi:hypothetical protein
MSLLDTRIERARGGVSAVTASTRDRSHARAWIALALSAAVVAAWAVGQLIHDRPDYAERSGPGWLPLAAAGLAAAGVILLLTGRPQLPRLHRALLWGGLLLMVWASGGLLLDLLRLVPGLMPDGVDWPGLLTRALALAAFVAIARLVFVRPAAHAAARGAGWCGYAALALALPYPVLKTWWALGGSFGLLWPGADGLTGSFTLWLPAVPWLLAAALSLLLVLTPRRLPRRLLLLAGWSATAIVATFGPAACWAFFTDLAEGEVETGGMQTWVFGVVYGSWFLWAIAAAAATRAYQVRTAPASATRC